MRNAVAELGGLVVEGVEGEGFEGGGEAGGANRVDDCGGHDGEALRGRLSREIVFVLGNEGMSWASSLIWWHVNSERKCTF